MNELPPPPIVNVEEEVQQDVVVVETLSDEERQQDERNTVEIVSDEIFFVLDNTSEISSYLDSERSNNLRDVIIVDGEEFYDELSMMLTPNELDQLFITDGDGQLLFPGGLTVTVEVSFSESEDESKIPYSLSLKIRHEPLETYGQESGAGGLGYTLPAENNSSLRLINIQASIESGARNTFLQRSLGPDGIGSEMSGGIVEGNQIIWARNLEGKVLGQQESLTLSEAEQHPDSFYTGSFLEEFNEWLEDAQN